MHLQLGHVLTKSELVLGFWVKDLGFYREDRVGTSFPAESQNLILVLALDV